MDLPNKSITELIAKDRYKAATAHDNRVVNNDYDDYDYDECGKNDNNNIDDHCKIKTERKSSSSDSSSLIGGDRSKLVKFIGKIIILSTVISFLFVGCLINIIQVILITTIQLSKNSQWKRWHKRINSQLVYILFSPPICLLYYWSNVSLKIELDDMKLIEMAKNPLLGIIIPNHSYELDYLISFVLADQLGGVGCYKSMSKDELKYLPIIGWSMWMSDIIFVKRDWKRDRHIIGHKLDALLDYDQTILGIFAEGTRFTPEKHQLSIEFARSRQLKPFKYHLIPRARGFNYTVRHYLREIILNKRVSENQFIILNLQIVMPDKPKFRDFIDGRQLRADVYCEEIKLEPEVREEILNSIDEDHCPKLSKLLMDIYRRKDELMDDYIINGGNFSRKNPKTGGLFPFYRRRLTFFIWLAGFCLTYGSLGYLAVNYLAKSILFWSILLSFIFGCIKMLKRIARESKISSINATATTPASTSTSADATNTDADAEEGLKVNNFKLSCRQRIYDDNNIPVKQKLV